MERILLYSHIKIFTPISIGSMQVKNRIVMPAMETNFSLEDGSISPQLIAYYLERVRGGVGYVTVENTDIHPSGLANRKMLRLDDDKYIDGFSQLAKAIHDIGCKIVVQLSHAGRQTLSWVTGEQPLAPSAIPCSLLKEMPKELDKKQIEELIESFVLAAERVKASGCDGVEFHMAHGYLICQFFSSYSNTRVDEFGGSLENRSRFGAEIVRRSRKRLGFDFPIICKISVDEFVPNGLCLDESKNIAKYLEQAGANAIMASACNYASYAYNIPSYYLPEGCFVDLAQGIKSAVSIPVIAIGRIRTITMAEEILEQGKADLVAMGRALIADPNLPNKALRNAYSEIRPCISCNRCIESIGHTDDRLVCTVNPEVGYEAKLKDNGYPKRSNVLIIGSGPGGLEAARVASIMGYKVTIYEQDLIIG